MPSSLSHIIHTINGSTYKLDMSGVVGLFGGDNAVDALETIHLYAGRRWAGWYNYPGTVTVAKRFGQMANSRFWDSIFPGPNESPAVTFNLAGKPGPEYSGSFSGTELRTKYLGYLIAAQCTASPRKPLSLFKKDGKEARKTGSSAAVTIISLPQRQHKREFLIKPIKLRHDPLALFALLPSLVSILACVFCFLAHDPICASLIIVGIVSSGFSSLALGSATLKIHVPVPSAGSPVGDGLMVQGDGSAIVLKGEEGDVNLITKGDYVLDYSTGILPHPKHHTIGITSLLLMAQFLAQLLLIPRCTFFGQILFLASFVASGMYHSYVVSHETESVHRALLLREFPMRMEKWTPGTRTQMAVFVCLVLGDGRQNPLKADSAAALIRIIPNKTAVWGYWRRKVLRELELFWKWDPASSRPYAPSIQVEPEDKTDIEEYSCFTDQDKKLLNDLIDDAWCVFNRYRQWRDGESEIGREGGDHTEESLKTHLLPGDSPA